MKKNGKLCTLRRTCFFLAERESNGEKKFGTFSF